MGHSEMDALESALRKAEGKTSKAESWMVDNGLLPKEGATSGAIEDIEGTTKKPPSDSTAPSPASLRPRPAPRPAPQPPASPPTPPGAPPEAKKGAPPEARKGAPPEAKKGAPPPAPP